ncbi:MAG: septal ring lytic transglycosylase RlpA family protein [Flavobacterium sp.]
MKKLITLLFVLVAFVATEAQNKNAEKSKKTTSNFATPKITASSDTVKKTYPIAIKNGIVKDSLFDEVIGKVKLYKKSAHASYYADKFNGRGTASGVKFNNNKYTAAHKKLPFGTKLRITNEANGKSVIVVVNDRGPFVKSRDIDLTKRAFMEIAKNKGAGAMKVTIEEIIP